MNDDDSKQKRNKPCETCRTHRRKCILQQPNYCERCQRLAIPCYFKFATKPPSARKKLISASKKNRLFKKIWLLEQEAAFLETELYDVSTTLAPIMAHRQTNKTESWQVSIQRIQHKLIMDTNITSTNELLALMQHVTNCFTHQPTPLASTSISSHGQQPTLRITLLVTPFEKALREMFASISALSITNTKNDENTPTTTMDNDDDVMEWTRIKHHLIDIYFTCPHLHNPVLIEPYYRRYMHQHLDDMISWAAAAFVAYSPCHHVKAFFQHQQQPSSSSWSRLKVGERCRLEAKRLFEEAIFLDWDVVDPSLAVSWVFTAYMLAHCHLFTLGNNQARIYVDMGWRLVVQLKHVYVPILTNAHRTNNNNNEQQVIFAETWRRLYLVTRYTEISMNVVNDHAIDVAQLTQHCIDIGFPRLLACEQHNKTLADAVEAFHYVTNLSHVGFLGDDERLSTLSFQLYTGKLATIGSDDVVAMQNRFIKWWYGLPHRIGTAPLDYIQMDWVHQCPSVRFLRVNAGYYIMLMSTMLRLMQDPEASDLTGASYNRMDNDRALLVVSICCDATIKIYHVLHVRFPCIIELHWLTIVLDTVLILINAKNPDIRRRAQQGARTAKRIFKQQAGKHHGGGESVHSCPPEQQQQQQLAPAAAAAAHTPESSYSWSTDLTSPSSSTTTTNVSSPQPSLPPSSSNTSHDRQHKSTPSSIHSYTTYHDLLAQQMDAHLATKDSFFYL